MARQSHLLEDIHKRRLTRLAQAVYTSVSARRLQGLNVKSAALALTQAQEGVTREVERFLQLIEDGMSTDHLTDRIQTVKAHADNVASYANGLKDVAVRAHRTLNSSSSRTLEFRDILTQLHTIEKDFGVKIQTLTRPEFDESIDGMRNSEFLVVRTDDVRLTSAAPRNDTFNFGKFDIELSLDGLAKGHARPFKIRAIDPQVFPGRETITHPHVKDDELCMGDAESGIKSALRAGRLHSFFTIVRQTLSFYNARSPYLTLETWLYRTGTCSGCADPLGETGMTHECANCERSICSSCHRGCNRCSSTLCVSCIQSHQNDDESFSEECGSPGCVIRAGNDDTYTCGSCGDDYDEEHMRACPVADTRICTDCLTTRAENEEPCFLRRHDCSCQGSTRNGCRLPEFGWDPAATAAETNTW